MKNSAPLFAAFLALFFSPFLIEKSSAQNCQNNLLQNAGFESDFQNWDGSGGEIGAAPNVASGSKSLKMCVSGHSRRQTLAATVGKNYRFQWTAKTAGAGQNVLFGLKFLSATWQPLATEWSSFDSPTAFSTNFIQKTAPAGAVWVEVGIIKQNAGCIYVDDLCLTDGGTTTGGQKPDLIVQDFTFQNGTTHAVGGSIQVTPFIGNLGPASFNVSGNEIARFYLSTDAVLSANDSPLNGFWHPQTTIAAGATISEPMLVFISPTAPTGAFFLICATDYPALIDEVSETNNTLAKAVTITGGTPPPSGCTGNLLTNPSFENGLNDWGNEGGSSVLSITGGANGTANAAQICSQTGSRLYQTKPATAGKTYTLKSFVRSENSSVLPQMGISIKFMSATWQPLLVKNSPTAFSQSAFQEVLISETAPVGTAWVEVSLLQKTAGCLVFDEICLSENGTQPPACSIVGTATNLICNSNNTPNDPSDDIFAFTANATGTNASTQFLFKIDGITRVGSYGNSSLSDYFPIAGGPRLIEFWDSGDPNCKNSFTITPPPTCSNLQLQPDLTIQNLTVSAASVEQQKTVQVAFDIKNIGALASTTPPNIAQTTVYLSTDATLDATDRAVSTFYFTPKSLAPNAVQKIDAPFLIPADQAVGSYFLIAKVDANNFETESNETNNTASKTLAVTAFSGFPCKKTVATGEIDCISYNSDGTLRIVSNENGTLFSRNVSATGTVSAATNLSAAVPFTLKLEAGKLVKRDAAGAVVFQKTIPAVLVSQFPFFEKAIECGGGYVLAAFKSVGATNADRGLTLIKTDVNLNQLAVKTFATFGDSAAARVQALLEATTDRVMVQFSVYAGNCGSVGFNGTETFLAVLDASMTERTRRKVGHNTCFTSPHLIFSNLRKTACGQFFAKRTTNWAYGGGGGTSIQLNVIDFYDLVGDTLRAAKTYIETSDGSYAGSNAQQTTSHSFKGMAPDGSILTSLHTYSSSTGTFTIALNPSTDSVRFASSTGLNVLKQPYSQYLHQELAKIGSKYFIVHQDATTKKITIADLDCDNNGGTTNPPTGGADLKITIAADKTTVPQWGNVKFTVTLKNEGTTPISAATIKIGGCAGGVFSNFDSNFKLVYAGTPGAPTAGAYNFITQEWAISNLAAGAQAVLTLPLFTTSTSEKKVVAWAKTQSPSDPDSQPSVTIFSNCTPAQDDEAVATINLGNPLLAGGDRAEIIIEEDLLLRDFSVFPNPSDGRASLFLENQKGKRVEISVIDALGRRVFFERIERLEQPVFELDLEAENAGVYFLKIEADGERAAVKRLIINKL